MPGSPRNASGTTRGGCRGVVRGVQQRQRPAHQRWRCLACCAWNCLPWPLAQAQKTPVAWVGPVVAVSWARSASVTQSHKRLPQCGCPECAAQIRPCPQVRSLLLMALCSLVVETVCHYARRKRRCVPEVSFMGVVAVDIAPTSALGCLQPQP